MNIKLMTDVDMAGKRVLIREDLNVPMKNGQVANDNRIRAALPTIRRALDAGAGVLVMSHLGRPVEGEENPDLSLRPVAGVLSALLGVPVRFEEEYLNQPVPVAPGEVVLLENVRFNKGEKKNDPELGKKLAALGDVFVMDAFATAHRAEASTAAVARFAAVACAGPLLAAEVRALGHALEDPARPLTAVIGGSKVSTKLTLLEKLVEKVDTLIPGGGIANTFLMAAGKPVGKSLADADLVDAARAIMRKAKDSGCELPLPLDVVTAPALSEQAQATVKRVENVGPEEMILDIGPDTAARYARILKASGTVIWNGPVGAFEMSQFSEGTKRIAVAIAESPAFSLVGGGDTVAAVQQYGLGEKMGYTSTAGGAFLEFLEGRSLPAIVALEERYEK